MTNQAIAPPIADWIAGFSLDHAPDAARHEAQRSILDVIGVSLAGANHETCRRIGALVAVEHGSGRCTVLGSVVPGSASAAALVNGTAAHVLDFDDVSYEGMVHATAVVWPAVLAAAEMVGASGRQTMAAFIAGVEVDCALGRAFTHDLFWRGFWTTGMLGAIAAAAGAAKAMELDAATIVTVIEIAAAQASGLRAIVGSPMKPVACGLAAETGLRAALLARAGIRGPDNLVGHRHGFAAMLNDGKLLFEEVAKLGRHYVLAAAPMAFKQFPICSYGQAAVEALLDARAALGSPLARAVCEVPAGVVDNMPYGHPANPTEAQFSLPFALGAGLAFGGLAPSHLTAATLADSRLTAAIGRIEVRVAAGEAAAALAGAREGAVVTVEADDGRRISRIVRVPTGMPGRPISDGGLEAKFRACANSVIGADRAAHLLERIRGLDRSAEIGQLFSGQGR
jgi:2-methylcitrate dehydratase PrpD